MELTKPSTSHRITLAWRTVPTATSTKLQTTLVFLALPIVLLVSPFNLVLDVTTLLFFLILNVSSNVLLTMSLTNLLNNAFFVFLT